jgi:arylsulfatase
MNALLITADQHLATCLAHEGHPQVLTPNLDRLAAESVRFRRAYTQSPICTPSRVSFLSGQYCHNHGYYGLSGPAPHRLPSFFSHFKQHGYRTAGIGNLHTPNHPRNWLADHLDLFDDTFESVDGEDSETAWYEEIRRRDLEAKEDFYIFKTDPKLAMEGMPSHLPFELSQEGWCVESAIRFMKECGGRPFCMHVSLERPHQPFYPAKQFWDMYPADLALPPTIYQDPAHRPPHFREAYNWFRAYPWAIEPKDFESGARRMWRAYLACITHVDHAVGLLLDHLQQAGLAQDTIVIYTADHGSYSGTYGIQEKAPGICSDAVCRVPSIWRVPGGKPGTICSHFVESVDIAPTLSALCQLPAMETVDGRDISALLHGADKAVREVAVTENPWSKGLRWRQWRFVHYQPEMFGGEDVGELYDLERDPNETRNLYHDPAHRDTVAQCRQLLLEWLIRTTRVKTVWPALDWSKHPYDYHTAADGKESNTAGPAYGVRKGQLNYI